MSSRDTTLLCYRTACPAPAHPCGYNRITHGLYCLQCAEKIAESTPPGEATLFPLLQFAETDISGGAYVEGVIRMRKENQ